MIKLISAKAEDKDSPAKVFLELRDDSFPEVKHTLKLHQGKSGQWYPELQVCLNGCENENVQHLRIAVSEVLDYLSNMLRLEEAKAIKLMTDMVSK